MTTMNNQELFYFCEQYSIILHSGIAAIDGLSILAEDTNGEQDEALLKKMQEDMEIHGSLAHALEQTGLFPESMISYVKVGEETGCLDEVMRNLAVHYKNEHEIATQIRSAVSYPLLMLLMMGAVIVILLVKVLPVFQQVFRQLGMEMNGISKGLLNAGTAISRYSTVLLVIAVLLIGGVLFLIFHPAGRNAASKAIARIPGLKNIPIARDYGRLTQALALGLRSGLTPEHSMELAKPLLNHPEIQEHFEKASQLLNEGASYLDSMTESGLFRGMDARLISIGFQTGASDEVMNSLSEKYQQEALVSVSNAVAIMEPTIIIVLSVMVGLVLLAVMMPLLGVFSGMIG